MGRFDCVDKEAPMGNLIDLVGQQTTNYLDSTRRKTQRRK
jgi:hypothetical protein